MGNSRASVGRTFQSRRGNTQSPVGRILPRENLASDDVAKAQAEVLQGVFGALKSPAKEMARDTGLNERACRNQIAGVNCMNLADFFNACKAIPELAEWGAEMMGLSGQRQADAVNHGMRAITLRIEASGVTLSKDEEH